MFSKRFCCVFSGFKICFGVSKVLDCCFFVSLQGFEKFLRAVVSSQKTVIRLCHRVFECP